MCVCTCTRVGLSCYLKKELGATAASCVVLDRVLAILGSTGGTCDHGLGVADEDIVTQNDHVHRNSRAPNAL